MEGTWNMHVVFGRDKIAMHNLCYGPVSEMLGSA